MKTKHRYEARDMRTGESKKFAAVRARNAWIKESPTHRTVWPVNAAVRRAARKEPTEEHPLLGFVCLLFCGACWYVSFIMLAAWMS